jgi:hypothetical protein
VVAFQQFRDVVDVQWGLIVKTFGGVQLHVKTFYCLLSSCPYHIRLGDNLPRVQGLLARWGGFLGRCRGPGL